MGHTHTYGRTDEMTSVFSGLDSLQRLLQNKIKEIAYLLQYSQGKTVLYYTCVHPISV